MTTWQQEIENSITDIKELKKCSVLTDDEIETINNQKKITFKITPHLLNLIQYNDTNGSIRKQFIPSKQESFSSNSFEDDYLCEKSNEVCENLIIRYSHKAILLVTNNCPAYCQFCTRKRINDGNKHMNYLEQAYQYLSSHSEIYDIIITGGDPLILNDIELEEILIRLSEIKSIKIIRINTRVPVTIPKRITSKLIKLLKKYNVINMNIHFEHPDELSDETIKACHRLANNGIILGSQSVLLKNINNNRETLKSLFLKLLLAKVRPYYLYQCDKINGCQQFYTDPIEGINLLNSISAELPGICIPRFVIDAPDKMGKITVAPNGILNQNDDYIKLKNFSNNMEYTYFLLDRGENYETTEN